MPNAPADDVGFSIPLDLSNDNTNSDINSLSSDNTLANGNSAGTKFTAALPVSANNGESMGE